MSKSTQPWPVRDSFTETLRDYADDLEETAHETDDPAEADVYRVLAAIGRGNTPPRDAAKRVHERARREHR